MAELLIFAAVAGIAGIAAIPFGVSELRRCRNWKSVAAEMDLEVPDWLIGVNTLKGRLRGFDVQIHYMPEGKNQDIVAKVYGVDPGFTLGQDSALLRMIKPDIETGDPTFDERMRIEGDGDRALAVLDDKARWLIEILFSGQGGEIKNKSLSTRFGDIRHAPSTLETMLDLAQILREPRDHELPGLLARRALEDSSSGVRLQAFRRLSSMFFASDEARGTAEQLLDARGAGLRLEAARVLLKGKAREERAVEVLKELATRRDVDSALRREAIETLAHSNHGHAAAPISAALLSSSSAEPETVRRAALESLVQSRAHDELLEVQPADTAETQLLARGLGFLDISAQPRLLSFLEHPEDNVRREAAIALGRVGDLDAVAPLRQVAGTGTLIRSAVVRAAESAISDIQGRAGGSQAGEISLVSEEPLQGAVSPVDEDEHAILGGEVSLTS